MGMRTIKPTSNSRRNTVLPDFSELTGDRPEKTLLSDKRERAGRNNNGRVTTRHRGSGAKRQYRIIDFKRDHKRPGKVMTIEYDPNRNARISLIQYPDGEKRYMVAFEGIKVGQTVSAGEGVELVNGNSLFLNGIPVGTYIHNLEVSPGNGAKLVRSAGAIAQIMAQEGRYTLIRLPSGEVRRLLSTCRATIGQVGNIDHKHIKLGKAWRARHMGLRPEVRGAVMSPRDHPHGGGEGRNGAGMPHRKTKWGKAALGPRTRDNNRTDRLILRHRYQK